MRVGQDLCKMKVSPDVPLLVATGGKENDLKLWDGTRPDAPPVFKAKNVSFNCSSMHYVVINNITDAVCTLHSLPMISSA